MKVFVLQIIEVINSDAVTEVKLFKDIENAKRGLKGKYLEILDWIHLNEDEDNWTISETDTDYFIEDGDCQNRFEGYIKETEIL